MIIAHKGNTPEIDPEAWVAENATIIGDVHIGKEAGIWFQTVVRGDVNKIEIGQQTNIQDLSVLHVDHGEYPLLIGSGVTVGHNAVLHGCTVEDNVLIGMGAILMNGVTVGRNSIIGAGSVVPQCSKIPPGTLITGIPAKMKRKVKACEIEMIKESAENYVRYMKSYDAKIY